jgi:crotonobetainyl-CoA:carnitine CoA-transferase CaiB-like acyl-CoA transferase
MSKAGNVNPFAGLKVVDVSPNRVGAQVSQLFADFGADVVQVEPPNGATIRAHAAYPFWARGKRSICLDLQSDSDRDVVRQLILSADIVVESFQPGVLDDLGLGFVELHPLNPKLIYTSITGFGRNGPYANAPGYEGVVLAKLGVFHTFQRMSNQKRPPFVSAPFGSFSASQTALHGTLAALIHREKTGRGQHVETNLLQAFTSLDTWAWFEHLIATRWPEAFKTTLAFDAEGRPASPFAFMLLVCVTKDGNWLQFAAVAPHLFAAQMKALGLAWMFTDDEWKGIPLFPDAEKRDALWTKMIEAAGEKTLAEWQAIFETDDNVFAEQFRSGPTSLQHPQLIHDEMVVDLIDAERGVVHQPGAIVKATNTPAQIDRSAPRLDEHRNEILAELNVTGAATEPHANGQSAPGRLPLGRLPLEGVTVLELATLFAAPHGTTMLTDLGARVFKVEPLAGDRIRNIVSFPESGGAKVMQGKESIAVDITTAEGLAIVQELAARVDVVVQGYRAGAMKRAGLDYESVKKLNPNVIYVNAPGYGVDGPYGTKPAYAPSIGAAAGIPLNNLGHSVGADANMPMDKIKDGARRLAAASAMVNAQADGFAALGVTTAVLFGLAARERGAGGQELFSSMLNTGAHAMSAHAVSYPGAPIEPIVDDDFRGLTPLYRNYDAASGQVFLAALSLPDWERLAQALVAHVDLVNDARFATASAREQNASALIDLLGGVFAKQAADKWEAELLPLGVGCVEVTTRTIEAMMFDDDFGRASGYIADVVHPTFEEHPRLAPYVRFSDSMTQALPGVLNGEQTDAILRELGRTDDQIAELRSRSIVG